MRTVTFKIEESMLELLDAYAIKHRLYRSDAIRLAIKRLLEEEAKNETVTLKVEKIKL